MVESPLLALRQVPARANGRQPAFRDVNREVGDGDWPAYRLGERDCGASAVWSVPSLEAFLSLSQSMDEEICYFRNTDGYSYLKVPDEDGPTWISEHTLTALATNDPEDVFSPGSECHHKLSTPCSAGVRVDVPKNIEVIDCSEHRSQHASGDVEQARAEEVL